MTQTLHSIASIALTLFVALGSADAAHGSAPDPLHGVWEGLAIATSEGKTWHEYVAFEFSPDGAMTMANAREAEAVTGTWTRTGDGLRLSIPGRPPATLDRLKIDSNHLSARLGYGEGQGVTLDLSPAGQNVPLEPLASGSSVRAADVTVDSVRLGESMLRFYRRRLYAAPCDDDPLPEHKLRVVVYAASPCRNRQFANKTSFVVFTDLDADSPKDQPVRTVAWLGGSHFDSRSNFPLKLGQRVRGKSGRKKLASALGQRVQRTMTLKRNSRLNVTTTSGAIHLLDDGKRLVGVVLGPMPSSADNDLWSGIMQMWEKYTVETKK